MTVAVVTTVSTMVTTVSTMVTAIPTMVSAMPTAVIAAVVLIAATRFIAVKFMTVVVAVKLAMLATMGICAVVAMMRVIAIIDVAVPAMRAVEPWTCTQEDSAGEPFWTVVAIGTAVVRSVVVVSVGADGCRSYIHTEAERDLSFCR
jgi:hypothetical protein